MSNSDTPSRIQWLDGCRGAAILMVVLFHAYAGWPEVMPFGATYAVPPFQWGWMGVQLFFLISGYVIPLTLRSSRGPAEFLFRRWSRLFPAMAVATLLIVATSPLLPQRPSGPPRLLQLLPGLTFIEPGWWDRFLGLQDTILEGSFWSLFVEVKFYVVASLLWFAGRPRWLVPGLVLCFVAFLSIQIPVLSHSPLSSLAHAMSFRWFGWFAAGACFEGASTSRSRKFLVLGIFLGLVSAAVERGTADISVVAALAGIGLLFAAASWIPAIPRVRIPRVLLFLGGVSYPLYLIHENAMVAMTIQLGRRNSLLPDWILPLAPLALLTAVAWVVAHWIEPPIRSALWTCWNRFRPGLRTTS